MKIALSKILPLKLHVSLYNILISLTFCINLGQTSYYVLNRPPIEVPRWVYSLSILLIELDNKEKSYCKLLQKLF